MNNRYFVLVSVGIFLTEYFFSIIWPSLLEVNLFSIWVLAVFFLNRGQKVNLAVILTITIGFDLWSGNFFGVLTLSLLFMSLIIFLVKKIMLMEGRGMVPAVLWLTGFYYLFLFLNAAVGSFYEKFAMPVLNFTGLMKIIIWVIMTVILHKIFSNEKRVSRF
ncbi:MAG: hypothetical protein G01um101444_43 [Parcubacteria group bacterium Gr01-1014_44]|nr:MAG: hypothetical protein G01um101444_43 [Parcubacteria group bacterium Gr01-1014_44]